MNVMSRIILENDRARPARPHRGERFNAAVDAACRRACEAIAPAWPLDRAIAVNPHWQRVGRPLREVAARLAALGGMTVFPPAALRAQAQAEGQLTADDLALARRMLAVQATSSADTAPALPLLIDLLDDDPDRHARLSWRQAITHQVSQACAAWFDHAQAEWQPRREGGLYAFWRETLRHDHGIGVLMGLPGLGRALDAIPERREDAERWVLRRLGLPRQAWADYLEAVLLTVNGWASWCAWLGWQARLEGRDDEHLRELLAIRLAWGALLLECRGEAAFERATAKLRTAWREAPAVFEAHAKALAEDEAWQLALDLGYQRELAARLAGAGAACNADDAPVETAVEVQAVFCIDVRSEPLRRAIENAWPAVATLGFAGFFGVPAAYTPLGTPARRPQLPGLLAPAVEIVDRVDDAHAETDAKATRRERLALRERWASASRWPATAFGFVESAGLGYVGALGRWLRPPAATRARDDLAGLAPRHRAQCRPRLQGMSPAGRVALAAGLLRGMGLERGHAPLVLLVGHGSQSANNAQAAALECGACGGQTGEANARAVAALLNDPAVREGLRGEGIDVPDETCFVAALHNTTTDEIEGFDLDLLPAAAHARWQRLQPVLAQAGDQCRRERAPALGLDPRKPHARLLQDLRRRGSDGAQTRPEWGLAGNAALLIAPRARSRGAVLGGRCFLHDYDAGRDPDGRLLEQLMTAPMLVAHWINWQYHASTCDPLHFGSGNKVLHNVVGGTLGVFEGNGGDLRIGLARQSLHDGRRWMHAPVRLTVAIDAPRERILRIVERHAVLRDLLAHGWLHLWCLDGDAPLRLADGEWRALPWQEG